jgi:hypothetical protein
MTFASAPLAFGGAERSHNFTSVVISRRNPQKLLIPSRFVLAKTNANLPFEVLPLIIIFLFGSQNSHPQRKEFPWSETPHSCYCRAHAVSVTIYNGTVELETNGWNVSLYVRQFDTSTKQWTRVPSFKVRRVSGFVRTGFFVGSFFGADFRMTRSF